MVEVYFNGGRVALHQRKSNQLRDPIVVPEHMPEAHRKYLSYNADDFTLWADSIGKSTSEVVDLFLFSGKEPEQGFKACANLTKLCEKYGSERFELACEHALNYAKTPTVRMITAALKSRQHTEDHSDTSESHYGITRGASYYAKEENADE